MPALRVNYHRVVCGRLATSPGTARIAKDNVIYDLDFLRRIYHAIRLNRLKSPLIGKFAGLGVRE